MHSQAYAPATALALSLPNLPVDVLLHVFRGLDIPDLVSLRKTCRALEGVTRDRSVWHEVLSVFLRYGSPVPGLNESDIIHLSAEDLERYTVRAYRLRANWTSQQPRCFSQVDLHPIRRSYDASSCRNLAAEFLPGSQGRYLLTLTLFDSTSEREHRRYSFECWDISAAQPQLLAELLVAGLLGFAVNSSSDSPHVLAVTQRDRVNQLTTTTYTLDFSTPGVQAWFRRTSQFDSFRQLLGLQGSYCVTTADDREVRIIHVDSGRVVCSLKVPLIHADPTLRLPEQHCIDYEIVGDFVLTFCKQWIYLYHLPFPLDASHSKLDAGSLPSEAPRLEPIAQYKYRWRTDTVIVSPRHSFRTSSRPPSIDLVIRFDTLYPWPVNILHHFVLPSNPTFSPSTFSPSDRSTFPYLTSESDTPIMVHSVPSPLRLFTPSDVVLGAYGTLLWLDACTDPTAPSQAGDHGQRVAMKVLTRTSLMDLDVEARTQVRMVMGAGTGTNNEQANGNAGQGAGGNTAAVQMWMALESATGSVAEDETRMSVLHAQDSHELWNRVAVNEEEGLVAVGHVDGRVSVYKYAPPE